MNSYSRASPSPRYLELLSLYHEMHEFGAQDQGLLAADTFDGKSLGPHVDTLKTIIKVLGSKTLLDYGAGKGVLYKAQNITSRDGMKFERICISKSFLLPGKKNFAQWRKCALHN